MEEKRKKAAVLGSTGSVGTQALEALAGIADFVLLTGGSNVSLLAKQARLYRAECCAVSSESAARELRLLLAGEDIRVVGGKGAIEEEILKCGADVIFQAENFPQNFGENCKIVIDNQNKISIIYK